jgi:4-amino-4-deoxy-L-arabinose transferase-like glycosyltransferase
MISAPGIRRYHAVLTLALLLTTLAALVLRIASIAEPLGIDQSLWASAARGMSRGQLLYRDVWEQRPPGIYWIYLAGFELFRWTPATVAWLDVIASASMTLLIFAIVRRLSTANTAALAAALYAVLTMPSWLYGYGGFLERSVCETFIVVCAGLSAWCAVRFVERPSTVMAAGIGLFCGAAVVLKPNAGLYLPALLLWTALYPPKTPGTPRIPLLRTLVLAGIGAAIGPAIALLWLWSLGLLREAAVAVIDFNRYYVGQGFTPAGYALIFSKAVWLRMKTDPLWLAGGVASAVAVVTLIRTRRLPPLAGLAVIWGAAATLVMVVNGARLFNSYFINALPPLAILAAWMLGESARESRGRRLVAIATGALMVALMVQRHYPSKVLGSARADLEMLRGRIAPQAYLEGFGGYDNRRGYSARANAELADYLRGHTKPEERIFLFGINGAGVYFLADRLAAHRFLRVNFFVATDFPDPRFTLPAVAADLAARRPRYLVFERLHSTSDAQVARMVDGLPWNPDLAGLLAAYRFETQIEDFAVYRALD